MKSYLICPTCGSDDVMKDGATRRGKQNYKCRDCGRQFVEDPQWKPIDPDRKAMVDVSKLRLRHRLLLEWIPSAGIARVMQLSANWLQRYVNRCYEVVPRTVQVQPKEPGRLAVQMDELWSFVDNKGNKQWVWLALSTREIGGCYIGDRSGGSAVALWESLPGCYRQCAVVYTDYWEAYIQALPSKRHHAVGKESGLISCIERFNNTLRQRVSRLVRKALPFSDLSITLERSGTSSTITTN